MNSLNLRILTLLALTGWLAACAHQRPATQEAVALPEHFSASGSAAIPTRFWQAFNDATLDQLVQQALRQNYSLAAKRETLIQADALLKQAKASYWPSLDASLGAARSSGDAIATVKSYSGGVAAAYELDLWGRVRSTADAAELDRMASADDLAAASITLAADVTSTWYQLLGQRGLQQLQQQQMATNEKVLQLIIARFQQGQADAADVLRQKVLLEQNRAALATYAASIAVLEHALAVLVGELPNTTPIPTISTLPDLAPLPDTGLTADWLQNRPDIRSAFYGMEAADARIAAAIAERYPRIDLSASYTSSANRASNLFDDWLENLAANLVLPVIDGGSRRAEVTRRESLFREAFATYQQTILAAVAEVEDALAQERFQLQRIEHLKTKMELNDQVVKRMSLRYRSGAVDYLDVLEALVTQQETEQDLVTARQLLLEYRIALARALAAGWEADPQSTLANSDSN